MPQGYRSHTRCISDYVVECCIIVRCDFSDSEFPVVRQCLSYPKRAQHDVHYFFVSVVRRVWGIDFSLSDDVQTLILRKPSPADRLS